MNNRYSFVITLALAFVWYSNESSACATCFGAEGSAQTEGLNMAIITLLTVTYSLFTGMAVMAFFYWKKNRVVSGNEDAATDVSSIEEASTVNV